MMTNIFIRIGNDAKNERMTILWYGTDVRKIGGRAVHGRAVTCRSPRNGKQMGTNGKRYTKIITTWLNTCFYSKAALLSSHVQPDRIRPDRIGPDRAGRADERAAIPF
ncbi:hypothetical protein [Nitratidesulfovibrio sp. 1201_IL3209]|uniref:hypothetical protein n=1 Tax=Nitratidesulfovibrio sp. 1201_IL3209 TaxID=3084053 RepID=UPI002FD9F905